MLSGQVMVPYAGQHVQQHFTIQLHPAPPVQQLSNSLLICAPLQFGCFDAVPVKAAGVESIMAWKQEARRHLSEGGTGGGGATTTKGTKLGFAT